MPGGRPITPTVIGRTLFEICDEFRKRERYKRIKEAFENFNIRIPPSVPIIMRLRGGTYYEVING